MTQGNGRWTDRKEDGFGAALSMSLHFADKPSLTRFPYWHLDLNAGCGWNDLADCEGSPLVFVGLASSYQRPIRAFFCDHDPAVDVLRRELEGLALPAHLSWECRCQDNAALLVDVASLIEANEDPRFAVGTVFCDPNGFPDGFPRQELRWFAARFPRIDLILSLNITLFRKVEKGRQSNPEHMKGFAHWPALRDIPAELSREHWLIRNPPPGGTGDQFTMLVGRNMRTGGSSPREFHDLASPTGQAILQTLNRVETGPLLPFGGYL